jgi:hypothetical protein
MRRIAGFFPGLRKNNLRHRGKPFMGKRPTVRNLHIKGFDGPYDIIKENQVGAVDLNIFNNTTFRGRRIGRDFVREVMQESGKSVGFSEVPLKKAGCSKLAQAMLGLIWDRDLAVYYNRGMKDELQGFNVSDFIYPEKHEVIAVDYQNIPDDQKIVQLLTHSSHLQEPVKVMNAIPAWVILMIITREGEALRADANPLYVDKEILTPELKTEFDNLTTEFYRISRLARQNINDPEIANFQEGIKIFYEKYAIEAKLGIKQVHAIHDEMKQLTENSKPTLRLT